LLQDHHPYTTETEDKAKIFDKVFTNAHHKDIMPMASDLQEWLNQIKTKASAPFVHMHGHVCSSSDNGWMRITIPIHNDFNMNIFLRVYHQSNISPDVVHVSFI
jgi:hypothetical protein